jgi:hypothetical protein
VSSASSSPVRSRDTLVSRKVTVTEAPTGTRRGFSERAQDSRYLARLAPIADSSGSTSSSAPTRTRSGSGMPSPHKAAVIPAAMKHLPRVVSAPKTVRIVVTGQPRGSGTRSTSRATT